MTPAASPSRPARDHIEPYQVLALSTAIRHIACRADMMDNIRRVERVLRSALWSASLQLPARLVTIPEGALQGFGDEIRITEHAEYAAQCAIDIPGPETDRLAEVCVSDNLFMMATAKARHPEFPGRFFNVGFIIGPDGSILLKHHKVAVLQPYEASLTPHSVWDRWVALYGHTLDAFYPVADTSIGRLGFMMANEAAFPENARGLALNGCEIAYRGPYPSASFASIQNQARALDNNMYVIGNQNGPTLPPDGMASEDVVDKWRHSMVVDYAGRIIAEMKHGGASTFLSATIDVEALRDYRTRAPWGTWLKELTTEQYRIIYDTPIFPKNIWIDQPPPADPQDRGQVLQRQVRLMVERGVWRYPGWTRDR